MKKLLFIIALLHTWFCNAQNYQCLQPGVKHYFINNKNYLRAIRIDSVVATADTSVYYPFKTRRKYPTYDTTRGSWLGGKVIQLADGTFIFDDLWGDHVTIKTVANVGDTWLFYSDTTHHAYIATVASTDTMTVLGTVDSVKKITINSYHHGVISSDDPVDGFTILLSKNNGFVKIFDLYTFPYYSPSEGSYTTGHDRYLDYVIDSYTGLYFPGIQNNSEFTIVPYHIPTALAMFDFEVGDMFAGNYHHFEFCPAGLNVDYTHYDSIISKTTVDSTHVNYAIHHLQRGSVYYGSTYCCSDSNDYVDTFYTDTSLVFLVKMPEEKVVSELAFYYYPMDTSFCYLSPAYWFTTPYIFEGCPINARFKEGFLPTYDTTRCTYSACAMGEPIYDETTDIMYYALKNGVSCGSVILPPIGVPNMATAKPINIFPNPAQNQLDISSAETINAIVISNLLGKVVYNRQFNAKIVQVDISDLLPGVYLIRINGTEVRKFVKE